MESVNQHTWSHGFCRLSSRDLRNHWGSLTGTFHLVPDVLFSAAFPINLLSNSKSQNDWSSIQHLKRSIVPTEKSTVLTKRSMVLTKKVHYTIERSILSINSQQNVHSVNGKLHDAAERCVVPNQKSILSTKRSVMKAVRSSNVSVE